MARTATALTLSDGSTRWGMVTLRDANGVITRQYPITAAQVAAVRAGGRPPLMLQATWESGRAIVEGRPCLRGMVYVNPDGSAVVNLGRRVVGNLIEQRFGQLAAAKWGVTAQGVVEVDADSVAEATVDSSYTD